MLLHDRVSAVQIALHHILQHFLLFNLAHSRSVIARNGLLHKPANRLLQLKVVAEDLVPQNLWDLQQKPVLVDFFIMVEVRVDKQVPAHHVDLLDDPRRYPRTLLHFFSELALARFERLNALSPVDDQLLEHVFHPLHQVCIHDHLGVDVWAAREVLQDPQDT